MNPYQTPNEMNREASATEMLRSHSLLRFRLAMFVWGTGTFLFPILIIIDILIGLKMPGGMVFVALVLGPILGILGALATTYQARGKIGLIVATLFLTPIQFIVTGLILIATTGLEGIQ